MVRTKGMVRNVFLLGIVLALLITAAWLLVRGSQWGSRPLLDPERVRVVREVTPGDSNESGESDGRTATGVLEIFGPELVFANSTLSREGSDFELKASGFNLSLLGNPALRLENTYPMFDLRLAGVSVSEEDAVRLEVREITPVFRVRAEEEFFPVDAATQDALLAELRTSSLIIPAASPEEPYILVLEQKQNNPLLLRGTSETATWFVFAEN